MLDRPLARRAVGARRPASTTRRCAIQLNGSADRRPRHPRQRGPHQDRRLAAGLRALPRRPARCWPARPAPRRSTSRRRPRSSSACSSPAPGRSASPAAEPLLLRHPRRHGLHHGHRRHRARRRLRPPGPHRLRPAARARPALRRSTVDRDASAARATPSATTSPSPTAAPRWSCPSLIGLENVDTAHGARVAAYELRRRAAGRRRTGQWVTGGRRWATPAIDDRTCAPTRSTGVQYAADGGVVGTTVAPGGWATWGVQAELDPDARRRSPSCSTRPAPAASAPASTSPSTRRACRRAASTPSAPTSRRSCARSAPTPPTRSTAILPDGEATVITSADDGPRPTSSRRGSPSTLHREWTGARSRRRAPRPRPTRGYLSRLVALDGTQLNGAAFALAAGRRRPPRRAAHARHHHPRLPVVGISTVGSAVHPRRHQRRLRPQAGQPRLGRRLGPRGDGCRAAPRRSPSPARRPASAPGELATARTTYAAPAASSGTVVLRGTAGLEGRPRQRLRARPARPLSVERQLPATLAATLVDTLVGDVGRRRRGLARRHRALHAHRRQPRRAVRSPAWPASVPVPANADARRRLRVGPRRRHGRHRRRRHGGASRCPTIAGAASRRRRLRRRRRAAVPERRRAHRGAGHGLGDGLDAVPDRRPGPARVGRPDAHDGHPARRRP